MRIIAGKYRGRKLREFAGKSVRPTSDRVKESLFQILSERLRGARVLDLFCGSGALGLESLSRGAAEVVFNDISSDSLRILRDNLALLKESAAITNLDFRTALNCARGKFDLIFADPPYSEDFRAELLGLVRKNALLNAGGLVVLESEREEPCEDGWEIADTRRYGRTKIFFFRLCERDSSVAAVGRNDR